MKKQSDGTKSYAGRAAFVAAAAAYGVPLKTVIVACREANGEHASSAHIRKEYRRALRRSAEIHSFVAALDLMARY